MFQKMNTIIVGCAAICYKKHFNCNVVMLIVGNKYRESDYVLHYYVKRCILCILSTFLIDSVIGI